MQAKTDHIWDQHYDGLSQDGSLRFNPADPPSKHPQRIDHRCVRIGSDKRIGESQRIATGFLCENDARQILQVDLMDDASCRGNHTEIAEGFLPPS